jgi:2-hydroxy-6-oxonona-2,4-dienedioate hydrolase
MTGQAAHRAALTGKRNAGGHSMLWPELAQGEFSLQYIDVNGVRTRCLSAGQADEPPLILLHGSGGHLETYTRNILAHAARMRVFAIDMLGHGFSDKPDFDYEIDHYVDHVADFCKTIGAPIVYLSGESLGGWVAARFAIRYPERVSKLVLNTAGGLTANPEVMERLRTLSMNAVRNPDREAVRKRLEWLMHDPKHVTDDLVEIRYRIYTLPGAERAMEHIMCLQFMEVRQRNMIPIADLRKIQCPTLVLWTTHDPTGKVEVGETFAREIPNARLVVMENCGHWPQFEQAETFNRIHSEFLAGS